MPQLELDVGGQTQRVDIPEGQQVTPEYVQSVASRLGAAASPAKQGQAQAAATAPSGPGFGGALREAVAERTTVPLSRMTQIPMPSQVGSVGSPSDMLGRLGAGAEFASTVASPLSSAVGALTEAAAANGGINSPWKEIMGGVAEIAGGGIGTVFKGSARRATVKALAKGDFKTAKTAVLGPQRTLTKEFEALGSAEAWPEERVGRELRSAAHAAFGRREKPIKAALNMMEAEASKHMMQPGSQAWTHVAGAVDDIKQFEIPLGKAARKYVDNLEVAIGQGQPLPARDAVKLRHILKRPQFTGIMGDPDVAPATKLIGNARDRLTLGVEAALREGGNAKTAADYNAALRAYRIEIADPKRAIRKVLSSKRSPLEAFNAAFNQKDPNAFRVLTDVLPKSPAMQTKVRLGYFEALRAATKDFSTAGEAMKHFDRTRPLLEASKLFAPNELDAIKSLLRRADSVDRAGAKLAQAMSNLPLKIAGYTGAAGSGSAALYAYAQDPKYLAMAALASGAAPLVYKLAMLPAGSIESKRLAGLIVKQVARAGRNVFAEETKDPNDVEEDQP